jgi:hypothetical protein
LGDAILVVGCFVLVAGVYYAVVGAGTIAAIATGAGGSGAPAKEIPYPTDPTVPPGPGFEWKGSTDPSGGKGNWVNPDTGVKLNPDLNHPEPIGPHWDISEPGMPESRWFPDGQILPK